MPYSVFVLDFVAAIFFDVANARARQHNIAVYNEEITNNVLWYLDNTLASHNNQICRTGYKWFNKEPFNIHCRRIAIVMAYISSIDERLEILWYELWRNPPAINHSFTDVWYAVAIGRKVE